MSVITNTVVGVAAVLTATGLVFSDQLLPPAPEPSWIVVCADVEIVGETIAAETRDCRMDGIPVQVILPSLSPP